VATTINLVLLAENRLTVPTQNRVTALRIGFFAQFLLIVAWALTSIASAPSARSNAAEALAVIAGLHLAMVATFTVTEDLVIPRRVMLQMQRPARWNWLLALVRPGGGRGAAYVLVQMALLVLAVALLDASATAIGWTLALCAYICLFSGMPAYVCRRLWPNRVTAFKLRVVTLVTVAMATVLPDVLYYVFWQPDLLDLDFGRRHLVNPFRALSNWPIVVNSGWVLMPALLGFAGVAAYLGLIRLGALRAPIAREPDGVPVLD
jgi:hypothetical protein